MSGPFQDAGLFLISTLFDLYLMILVVRLILCWIRADYFNPITQFVVKLTNPIVIPLRKILPTRGNIEWATVVIILLVELIKFLLIITISVGMAKNPFGLLILCLADFLKLIINTFFYAILIQAILSWVQPGYSPISQLLSKISSPIMRPIQRIVPPVGGFDISPIPALILLQLLIIILVTPFYNLGMVMVLR